MKKEEEERRLEYEERFIVRTGALFTEGLTGRCKHQRPPWCVPARGHNTSVPCGVFSHVANRLVVPVVCP